MKVAFSKRLSGRKAFTARRLMSKEAVAHAGARIENRIVQYVVVRRDLWKEKQWPLGSVIAQACHASSAALWITRDDATTLEYLQDVDNMTKVLLIC